MRLSQRNTKCSQTYLANGKFNGSNRDRHSQRTLFGESATSDLKRLVKLVEFDNNAWNIALKRAELTKLIDERRKMVAEYRNLHGVMGERFDVEL